MYKTALEKALDPWGDFWAFDDFFRVRPSRYEGFPVIHSRAEDDNAVVSAEIPGIDPESVDISVKDNTLTIKGERKDEALAEGEHYHSRERWHGSFTKSFRLPFRVEAENVAAEYKHGVLTIRLPRAEADKPRKITISAN